MKQITAKPHKTASIFGTNLVIGECCVLSELAAEAQLDRESMIWTHRFSSWRDDGLHVIYFIMHPLPKTYKRAGHTCQHALNRV